MSKIITRTAIAGTVALSIAGGPAMAEEKTSWKHGTSAASGFVIGAALAGPIGAIAGAVTGNWIGEKVDSVDEISAELAQSEQQTAVLEQQLATTQTELLDYRQFASQSLELEVLFHTNKSELTAATQARLMQLAEYVASHPDMSITLSGFADPRGSDLHNLALSEARVAAVAGLLVDAGIPPARINANAYGATTAVIGDSDTYALERRVVIELSPQSTGAQLSLDLEGDAETDIDENIDAALEQDAELSVNAGH